MSFKENLLNELYYNNLSIKCLSQKCNIPYTTLTSYTRENNCLPNCEHAVKIASVLNVTVEYLVCGKDTTITTKVYNKDTINLLASLSKDLQKLAEKFIYLCKELDDLKTFKENHHE